jgi:hypothetical protein
VAPLRSLLAADVLHEGLLHFADIEYTPLRDDVAFLDGAVGRRPRLLLDTDSAEEDRCWAMMDALTLLAFGERAATSARQVRRLRSVG